MASVGAISFGDRVVRQPPAAKRRYCDNVRVCVRTGWTSRCNAPLYFGRGIFAGGRCRVCDVVERLLLVPDGFEQRLVAHNEWNEKRHQANLWEFMATPYGIGASGGQGTDEECAAYERSRRPRAVIDDVEPYWQCSNREVLDEMGITAEVMSMAEAIAVRSYEQLDPSMQAFLDHPAGQDPDPAEAPVLPPGIGHTSAEWRRAIERLHRYDETWMAPLNRAMATRTKEEYGIGWLGHGRAYGALPYSQLRIGATISYVTLTSNSHWYGALPSPAVSVTGQPIIVAATNPTELDDG